MSVQSTLARIGYTISGAGPYTIPYYFLKDTDLVVIRTPVVGDPITLVLTTDYTVTGAGLEAGGTLTLVAPVNGDLLTIINEPPINQLSTFPETGKLPAKSIESALDKLTIVMKRAYDLASRGLRLNDGDAATSFVFPVSSPGKLIGWNSGGTLTNTSPTAIGPSSVTSVELADGAVTTTKLASVPLQTLAVITNTQATDLGAVSAFVGAALNEADAVAFHTAIATPLLASVASTSGTAIDFTGIPAGTKKITVLFSGVSTNAAGSANILVQLGDSGGIETSGYNGVLSLIGAATVSTSAGNTAGFHATAAIAAAATFSGSIVIANISGNNWVANTSIARTDSPTLNLYVGEKTLTAALDRLRVTTGNGTDTFDAGVVNIICE